MSAPFMWQESAPICEKENIMGTSKVASSIRRMGKVQKVSPLTDVSLNVQRYPEEIRNGVIPSAGDYDIIHPPTPDDCIMTSPKYSSQGDTIMTEVLPSETHPSRRNTEIHNIPGGALPEDATPVLWNSRTASPHIQRKRGKKRSRKKRILEDSPNHTYNFTPTDPEESVSVLNFVPAPDTNNLMQCQELSSGVVTECISAGQVAQHNKLENIPQFPKVESFETDENLPQPFPEPSLHDLPALDGIPLLPLTNNNPWVMKEEKDVKQNLEMTIQLMSGGATPHMVAVGEGGRDEINLTANRKKLTANRIRRLDILSRNGVKQGGLSTAEEEEKKRLLKLEKNRRAAQISREKKKRYILNLEARGAMMSKHLTALELENNQLRAILLTLSKRSNARKSNTNISAHVPITPKVEPMDD